MNPPAAGATNPTGAVPVMVFQAAAVFKVLMKLLRVSLNLAPDPTESIPQTGCWIVQILYG